MRCSNCGYENSAGLRFCEQCATPLPRELEESLQICANCGAENPEGLRFCEQCATPLGVERVEEPVLVEKPVAPPVVAVAEPVIVCLNCGAENPEGLRFCEQCATPLAVEKVEEPVVVDVIEPVVVCANCGAENPEGLRFCEQCATPLVEEKVEEPVVVEIPVAAPPLVTAPPRPRRRRAFVWAGLLAVPVLLLLFLVIVPFLRGGLLAQIPGGGDLSDVTRTEAAQIGSSVVEGMYPEFSGVVPVVQQGGSLGKQYYEVTFSVDHPIDGGSYPREVIVVIDTDSDQVFVLESN